MKPHPISEPEPPSNHGSQGCAASGDASPAERTPAELAGSGLLVAAREASPAELLTLLVERDPLELEERVRERLARRWLLLDRERVFQRSAARVTYRTVVDPPESTALEAWLDERVDEAIADCLSIDAYGRAGSRGPTRVDGHRLFAEGFGAGPEHARAASVHFHALPERVRRTLIELLMNDKTIEDCLEAGLGPRERLRADLELALDAASGDRARRDGVRTDVARTDVARTEVARTEEAHPDGALPVDAHPDGERARGVGGGSAIEGEVR